MVMYPVNVRHKGQVTIPASIRDEIGLKEGDCLLVQRGVGRSSSSRPETWSIPRRAPFVSTPTVNS